MGGSVPGEPGEESARCMADIDEADFVTLRLDTSDDVSLLRSRGKLGLEDVYESYVKDLQGPQERALPLRLGLCCAIWRDSHRHWELRSHELGLWPGSVLEMPADVLKARWQAAGCGQKDGALVSRWAGQVANSTRWVLAALHAKRKPLVVHDGLTDVLQLYDKFTGNLPADHLEFGRAWMEQFPIVLDTRLIAEQDEEQKELPTAPIETPPALTKWRCMPGSGGGLAELHKDLLEAPRPLRAVPSARFKEQGLYTHRASSGRSGIVTNSGIGSVARGAMEVAEVFLLLMGHKLQSAINDKAEESRKRRKTGPGPGQSAMSPSRSPHSRTLQKKTSTVSAITVSAISTAVSDGKSSRDVGAAPGSGAASAGSELGRAGSDGSSGAASKETVHKACEVGTPPKTPKAERKGAQLPAAKSDDAVVKPPADSCTSPENRRKRLRSNSSEKAAECSAALALLIERLAGIPKDDGSASGGEFSADLQSKAAAVCRYFHNRLAAPESIPGHLRLDTLLQVQLVKRLRKAQGVFNEAAASHQTTQVADKCKLQQAPKETPTPMTALVADWSN